MLEKSVKELDFYLVQGKDSNGEVVTKPFFDGIVKPSVIFLVYQK